MNKIPTLTDKEVNKILKIFGKEELVYRHIYNFVKLTSKQLDYVCSYDSKPKEHEEVKDIWRKIKKERLKLGK